MKFLNLSRPALGLAAFLFLTGCFLADDNQTAGTEDFPNTIHQAFNDGLDQSSHNQDLQDINTTVPAPTIATSTKSVSGLARLSASPKSLGRAAAADEETFVLDSSTSVADGDTLTYFEYKSNSTQNQVNTIKLVVEGSDTLVISTLSNTYNKLGNLMTSIRQGDADGDGFINAVPGGDNQTVLTTTHYFPLNTQITKLTTDAGPDEDFGGGENPTAEMDNRIISLDTLTLSLKGDTLHHTSIRDGDGDGFINPTAGGENLAEVSSRSRNILTGVMTHHRMILDAGPDEDFGENENPATLDNRILLYELSEISAEGDSLSLTRATDLDGDGYVAGAQADPVSQALFFKKVWVLGQIFIEEVAVDAGEDNDFDTENDNHVLFLEKVWLNESLDTLGFASVQDADKDGYAFDSTADSCIVLVHAGESLLNSKTRTTLVIFPQDSSKNYPVKFEKQVSIVDDFTTLTRIFGEGPDSLIDLNDSITLYRETRYTGNSAQNIETAIFEMGLGENLYDNSDNVMYSFSFDREFHTDPAAGASERKLSFIFVSDEPIPEGEKPAAGTISIDLTLQNGIDHHFEGRFEDNSVEGTYSNSEGKEVSGTWDLK